MVDNVEANPIPKRRFFTWNRRLRLWVLTLFGFVAAGLPTFIFVRRGLIGDVWWVWKSGQWMALHHAVLLHEPSSWTGVTLAGKPWVNLEWGWQLLLYLINPHLNPAIFVLFLGLCILTMLGAFWWALHVIAPKLPVEYAAGLSLIYACFFFSDTVRLRAEMFSYIAFPLLLGLLWQSRSKPGRLWLLIPLTLVWANLHGSWMMILVLAGLEAVASALHKNWSYVVRLILFGMVLPLATVVGLTPSHWHTITYAVWLDTNPQISNNIQEWQSTNFHTPIFLAMAAFVLAAWLWRARTRIPYPLILDVWFIGISLMFFQEVRIVTYFGMVAMIWLGYGLASRERLISAVAVPRGRFRRYAAIFLGAGAISLAAAIPTAPELLAHPPVPPNVVQWINRHPHQTIFDPYADGGYLIAQNVRGVYMDGRTDFYLYNDHRFQWYVKILNGQATPQGIAHEFQRNRVRWILWPKASVNANLSWFIEHNHWKKRYNRHGWVIFASPIIS